MAVLELSREMEDHARTLHQETFVMDGNLPPRGMAYDADNEIKAFMDGGINAVFFTLVNAGYDFSKAMDSFVQFNKLVARHSETLARCTTVTDLKQCEQQGKLGLVPFFQDTKPIDERLDYLQIFYDLGLRVLQLTYNAQNYVGSGCCERNEAGLTYFGLEVVAECNRLRILIDLSHCGHGTSWDAIKHSKAPVAATHSGVYSLCPAYGRNKPDDMLKAIADGGGVVGIPFFAPFVKRNPLTNEVLQGTVNDVLDQVDYAVKLMGIDHVAIGSDLSDYDARTLEAPSNSSITNRIRRPDVFGAGRMDRYEPWPIDIDSHEKFPNLTRGLVQRGYRDEDTKKIMGGNWLRLCKEVWQE